MSVVPHPRSLPSGAAQLALGPPGTDPVADLVGSDSPFTVQLQELGKGRHPALPNMDCDRLQDVGTVANSDDRAICADPVRPVSVTPPILGDAKGTDHPELLTLPPPGDFVQSDVTAVSSVVIEGVTRCHLRVFQVFRDDPQGVRWGFAGGLLVHG